jgi:uncharacterized protein DUF6994
VVDVSFDFRADTPRDKNGKMLDPDTYSPTLREYHRLLWSKPLPSGAPFALDTSGWDYLRHSSELGEFRLTSDTGVQFWSNWDRMKDIMRLIPDAEHEVYWRLMYSIGSMIVWPCNMIDGKPTINMARGRHPLIDDRFDLTVECVRRHYLGEASPLADVLGRYPEFFALFGDFPGWVEFFLLQDLVDKTTCVKFFMPFDDFIGSPRPETLDDYLSYRRHAAEFIQARNRRISER